MSQIDRQSCRSADRTPSGICQCTTFPKSGSALVARVFTRLIGLFVALSAATAASNALAIGLGEIRTDSRLGQILRLEIPLQAAANEEIDEGCFRLVSTPASAGDALPWLSSASFRIENRGNQRFLTVTSRQAIQHPALMVGVQTQCGTSLRRDYALLLDPPMAAFEAPISKPIPADNPAAATPSAAKRLPPAAGDNEREYWQVAEGESIRSLSTALYPKDRKQQQGFERALRAANPKFAGTPARRPLPANASLTMPTLQESLKAAAEIRSAAATAPATEARPTTDEIAKPVTSSKKKTAKIAEETGPRLIVSQGDEGGLRMSTLIADRAEMSAEDRERLRVELQLIASLDEKIATQIELTEKLRKLEAMQLSLQADASRLESSIRAAQLESAAPATTVVPVKAAPAPHASGQWPSSPSALQLGLMALVLGSGLGVWWYRQRKAAEEVAAPPLEPLDITPAFDDGEVPDTLLESLSEEDIWPDQPEQLAPFKGSSQVMEGTLAPLTHLSLGPSSVLQINEAQGEEHDSAIELADIMMSFGRVQGAAQTLADFIRSNPKQAITPWLKLLEVYRAAGMEMEFKALVTQLNKTFNVQPVTWEDFDVARSAPESLENLTHISQHLCEIWGKQECQVYLHGLLRDNRQGTRQGFPLAVVDDILLLLAILESYLGPYKALPESEVGAVAEPMAAKTIPKVTPISEPLDFNAPTLPPNSPATETASFTTAGGGVDFELELADFTKTLTINLDELEDLPPSDEQKK